MNRFYLIRHRDTGEYLPVPPSRKGSTWLSLTKVQPPRLFISERAANCALTWWLKGCCALKFTNDDYTLVFGTDFVASEPDGVGVVLKRDIERGVMEVVPVTLTEVPR